MQQQEQALKEIWIAALFERFHARYGNRWVSAIEKIEKVAVSEWAKGLAGVTGEQIKNGLAKLDNHWPPTMTEFRDICLNKTKSNEFGMNYIPEVHRKTIYKPKAIMSDEAWKKKREIDKAGIARIRETLRG